MASGSVNLSSYQSWAGRIDWSSTVNPGQNTSSVSASCYVWRTDGGESFGNNPYWGRLWIGDQRVEVTFARINGDSQYVGSCWAQIPHDREGIARVSIGAAIYGSDNNDLTGSTLEGSETVELDTISQAGPSRISLNAETLQMGKKLLISIDPDQPDCKHDLQWTFGTGSGKLGTGIGTGYEWTVPDLARFCGLSGRCTITCKTYRRGTYLGSTEAGLTLLVPDPTKPSLSEITLGTEGTVACRRNSENFRLKLSLLLKDQEYTLKEGKFNSFAWTPPYELAKQMPDQIRMTGSLRCTTYNGNAAVGTKESPIRLIVPENQFTRPEIRTFTLAPRSQTLAPEFGYLRGKTGLTATMEAVSPVSSIGEYRLILGNKTVVGNPAEIEILEDSGVLRVTGEVQDLRGFTASVTKEITVLPYEKPRVIPSPGRETVVCSRAEASGALSPRGTYLAIRGGKQATVILKDGVNLNPCTLRYRWRQGNSDVFSPWISLLNEEKDQVETLISGIVTSLQHSYQVELSAVDQIGEEDRQIYSIMSEAISFVLYDGTDGAAFGKYPERPHVVDLAPHMTLLVRGNLELSGEKWEDLGLAPEIRPPVIPHGEAEGCKLRLSGGNHVYLAFSCRMPQENQAVNNRPIPEALRPKHPVSGLCAAEAGMVGVTADVDGFLRIRPLAGQPDPRWIDGRLDYFR